MNPGNPELSTFTDVTCPFCSLLCDDLEVTNQAGKLRVTGNGCPRARQQMEQDWPAASPRIKGKECSLEEAISQAAKILKQANQPLIHGLGADVNGIRAAVALAEKTGAIIDHMHSEGAYRNIKVLQDQGWVMTTLSEIRNRADFILFAGTDGVSHYPSFLERTIHNSKTLLDKDMARRRIVYLGDNLDVSHGKGPSVGKPQNIRCKQEHIGEIIAVLHALLAGNRLDAADIHGIRLAELEKLAQQMHQAQYGVIVWAPGELNFPHAELTIQSICELVKYMNRKTRFAGFSLGGNEGGVSAQNVCAWQSGYPLRVNYNKGFPDFDPYKYAADRVLENREADALCWISSISTDVRPPAKTGMPTIIMSNAAIDPGSAVDVFLPVATPGIHHAGQLLRVDSVVSLNLKKLQPGNHLSVSETINLILQSV